MSEMLHVTRVVVWFETLVTVRSWLAVQPLRCWLQLDSHATVTYQGYGATFRDASCSVNQSFGI